MKKIGWGWQYNVYDLENGRVLKKFHSPLGSYWVIIKTIFPFKEDPWWKIPSFSKSMKVKALASFEVLKRRELPPEWIGNPKFLNKLDFEQDKAEPLLDAFSRSTTLECKVIIDKFIVFNKKLLEKGVIDKSFNITKNYGLDSKGEIVLIDIGELFDDHDRVQQQINDRAWDKNYVAGCIENEEARRYFIEQCDEAFGNVSMHEFEV